MLGFVSVYSKFVCLDCGAILTNDSMKGAKLEHHPSSVGKDKEYCANRRIRQPAQLSDYAKTKDTAKMKILKPSYLLSEIIAKAAAP